MHYPARFRSVQRGLVALGALVPLLVIATVAPGFWDGSLAQWLWSIVLLFGPAILAAFGMAYALRWIVLGWLCVVASAVTVAVLVLAYYEAQSSSTAALAFLWVSAAYAAFFVTAFLGEAVHHSWQSSRTPSHR